MRRPLCLLCLLFVSLVMLFMAFFSERLLTKALPDNHSQFQLYGEIRAIETKQGKSVLYLKNSNAHLNVMCYLSDKASNVNDLKIGYQISVVGKVRCFDRATNDGQFDAKIYYAALDVDFAMTNCSYTITKRSVSWYRNILYKIKKTLSETLDHTLLADEAGVLKAMLLGDKSGMSEEIKGLYQRTGIAHIVAVSGLHITLWGMGICRFLRKLYIPLPIANAISFCFVVSYGILTGSQASAIRSVIMFSLYLFAQIVKRTYDLLTAMMLSAAILLFFQPFYVFYSGFLLSFGAVAGIALILPLFPELFHKRPLLKRMVSEKPSFLKKLHHKLLDFIISSFSVSLCVTIASFPIQIYFFSTFSTYSIFLNLLIASMVSFLMIFGMSGAVVGSICQPAGSILLYPCHLILILYEKICAVFDEMPLAHPVIAKPGIFRIILYYLILFLILDFIRFLTTGKIQRLGIWKTIGNGRDKTGKGGYKKLVVVGILFANILLISIPIRFHTSLTMLDIGQGDCFVIEEKNGKNILIDGGSSSVQNVGKYRIIPYLKSHGISTVDFVFLSHADIDHTNGILEILQDEKSDRIKISCLLLTQYAKDNQLYQEFVTAAKKSGTKIFYLTAGDTVKCGECLFTCIYPGMQTNKADAVDENDRSMVLCMQVKENRVLYMGDLTSGYEDEIVNSKYLSACDIDILKVGHHGSKYSTSKEFLSELQPKIGLISAGEYNRYGHPHTETLQRLEDVGSVVFSTPDHGAITVGFNQKVKIYCYRKRKD